MKSDGLPQIFEHFLPFRYLSTWYDRATIDPVNLAMATHSGANSPSSPVVRLWHGKQSLLASDTCNPRIGRSRVASPNMAEPNLGSVCHTPHSPSDVTGRAKRA